MAGMAFVRTVSKLLFGDPSFRLQRMIFREASRAFSLAQPSFPGMLHLPPGYGKRLPERVIELVLAKMTYFPGARVLDVGHSNIMECHKQLLATLEEPRHLTGIDIAVPTYDASKFYERSITADITSTGLNSCTFDRIWCISTLEHIGMDNAGYTKDFTLDLHLDETALREMYRLLAINGILLITVPFGKSEDHGWMKNYSLGSWHRLLAPVLKYGNSHELYFRYDPERGWRQVAPSELATTGYYDNSNAGASGLAAVIIQKPTDNDTSIHRP